MDIAVVILNWNGKKLLEEFLPSVITHSPKAHIYVADNASTDGSVAFLKQHFPQVRIIQFAENHGYSGGYNRAVAQLDEALIVLLNSDVEVSQGWLESVRQAFEQDKELAAACPKIMDYRKRNHFEYAGAAGGFMDRYGIPFCRGRVMDQLEKDDGQFDDDRPVFWASGACLIIRRSSFELAGGLDEDFFAHQEEIDLCWRLQQLGQKIMFLHRSTVYHLGGGTLAASDPRKTFLNFRNTLLLLYKNVAGLRAYRRIVIRLLMDGGAALYFLFTGRPAHALAVLKAHFSFYGLLKRFYKKRRKWAGPLEYAYIPSVVWAYFAEKKRTFKELGGQF